ncbi:SDR family NAD(P)-dependent oxidoreductase [Pseudooceanicola onchidii]|uniref:SDR family NAD(P)-dependent oxidoreductase n=1 Tax=Pseudooceanicola onchidii TaxID=2562279 RepID=UPI0010AA6461|nr:SDR family NAD(P)-dependent oxidoreductase [Pseudooceanicola onchidii]
MKIQGSGALVTGGGSGLGLAVAQMLADAGAEVTVLDRNAEAAEAAAKAIGGRAAAGDVTSEEDVQKAIDIADSGAPLRIVVNCAGIGPPEKMVGKNGPMPLANFETVIKVNLIGTFNVARLASARMLDRDPIDDNARGVIVNTASVAAFDGQIGQTAYSASKGGIVGMTLPMARELARSGIRVNTIAPGIFKTPLLASLPEDVQESLGHQVPYPSRLGDPADFANTVKFMVETQYMNGEVVRLDGAIRMAPK